MSGGLFALYAAVRGFIFVGLLLLTGSQAAPGVLSAGLRGDPEVADALHRRLVRLPGLLLLLLLLAVLARGLLQVLSFLDPGDTLTPDLTRSVLLTGTWGHAWLLQIAALTALGAFLWRRGDRPATPDRLTIAGTTVILWGQTGMGHAAGGTWHAPLGRLVDFAHLLGGGLWLGTLGVLLLVAVPVLRGDARLPVLADAVRRFSVNARIGATLLVVSGVIAAIVYGGSVPLVLESTWGRLLLVKLGGLLGVVALGWYNWRVVTPALEGSQPLAADRLRLAIRLELVLGLLMLAITALLVVSPLPGEG
jgi:putative copper resistance protein D